MSAYRVTVTLAPGTTRAEAEALAAELQERDSVMAAVASETGAGTSHETKAQRAEWLLFWIFREWWDAPPVLVSEIVKLGEHEGLTRDNLYRAAVRLDLDRIKLAGEPRPVAAWAPPGWKRGEPRRPRLTGD